MNATIIAAIRIGIGTITRARAEVVFLFIRSPDRSMCKLEAGELAMIWAAMSVSNGLKDWQGTYD